MKITLISPYNNFNSYGIRSMASYFRGNGRDISCVYLLNDYYTPYNGKVLNELIQLCADSDLIGVSVMSNYFMNCAQLTEMIRGSLKKVPIVWGGVHATIMPQECLRYCDIAVIGEGEKTFLEIAESIEKRLSLNSIPGTCASENGRPLRNPVRPLMSEEDLPVVDNDFSGDYILYKDKIRRLDPAMLKRHMTGDYVTLSSFGCLFSCSYCINNKLKELYGSRVRFRRVDDIIDELALARKKMPFIRHISFDDDAFIQRDLSGLSEFARKYKQNVGLPFFVSGFNPLFVNEEKMAVLISAGLDRVRMGVQSASKKSKIIYKRDIPNEKIISAAKIINKYKSKLKLTAFDLILDNPFEGREDVIETIHLLGRMPAPFTLNLFSLTFFPGTDMYREALSAGYIRDNIGDIYKKRLYSIDNNYLNFVILLFTIFKVPPLLLKVLLNKKIVDKDLRVPKGIFEFFKSIGLFKRGIDLLIKGDPYTLYRQLNLKAAKN